jgi:hypothetical protein
MIVDLSNPGWPIGREKVQYALTHHVAEDRAEWNATTSTRDRKHQNAGCARGPDFLVIRNFRYKYQGEDSECCCLCCDWTFG